MPVTEGAVAFFARRYQEATGIVPRRFVCPITLQDDLSADLCNGHIVSQGIDDANRSTVVQREDVDNRLGSLIERDFVKFANLRTAEPDEMLQDAQKLTITAPSGERMPAFFAGPEAKVRFQQIEMYDEEGKTIARPFLKSHSLENGQHKQLQVEWMFFIHRYAFTAAMLKSGYLALFKIFGYTWVLDTPGDKVRRTLDASLKANGRKQALDIFEDFEGSCWMIGNEQQPSSVGTLEDGTLLFHYTEGDVKNGLLFGVSCIFPINGAHMAVTLPLCNKFGHYFISWNYYQEFIKTRQLRHNMYLARIVDQAIHLQETPLTMHHVDKLPPDQAISIQLSPAPLRRRSVIVP